MLSKAFEFVRIADTHPSDDKVRRRKEAATLVCGRIVGLQTQQSIAS